jgi:glutamate--cysteine ligase
MTAMHEQALHDPPVLRSVSEAEGYIVSICFKNGPPRLLGLELEWTVHPVGDPTARVAPERLRAALGAHAPSTLSPDSPQLLLGGGGAVTVEPGGQVEISTPPRSSLAELVAMTTADTAQLDALLATEDLVRGDSAFDGARTPQPVLDTPRYRAMRDMFDRDGPSGRQMMYSTASFQVSIDAGTREQVADRWSAVHALGPVLVAAFANSAPPPSPGHGRGSRRMQSWLGIDPARSGPVSGGDGADPAGDWARYALAAPLICRRRPGRDWSVGGRVSFADWIRDPRSVQATAGWSGTPGPHVGPPTVDDLDYHLSTLFPPVRPRGYLEVRYLDTQPGSDWLGPAAVLAGLNTDDDLLDRARQICDPVRQRWRQAADLGLDDPPLAAAARALSDVAAEAITGTDLAPPQIAAAVELVERRFHPQEKS